MIDNEQGETTRLSARFAMTNDELDKAINTAARHSGDSYGHAKTGELMLKHLEALLAIQYARAGEVRVKVEEVGK